jgi:hypothetical protein
VCRCARWELLSSCPFGIAVARSQADDLALLHAFIHANFARFQRTLVTHSHLAELKLIALAHAREPSTPRQQASAAHTPPAAAIPTAGEVRFPSQPPVRASNAVRASVFEGVRACVRARACSCPCFERVRACVRAAAEA